MRTRPCRIIRTTVALISLVLLITGCAQRMQSMKEDSLADSNGPGSLQAIKVSDDGYQVEIVASKPLTYTHYKMSTPLSVIVDLAQTEPGAVTAPVEAAAGAVKRVEVAKQGFGQNVLSRITIALASDSDVTVQADPENKNKLYVKFAKPQAVKADTKAEAKVEEKVLKVEDLAAAPQVQAESDGKQAQGGMEAATVGKQLKAGQGSSTTGGAEAKGEGAQVVPAAKEQPKDPPAKKGKSLNAVNVVKDGVEVVVPGGVDTFNSFKLSDPSRLIVDIPGVKSNVTAKALDIKKFGIDKARLGITPDKVRIVFDATQKALPPYRIDKSDNGLMIQLQGVSASAPAVKAPGAAKVAAPEKASAPVKLPVEKKVSGTKPAAAKVSSVESIDFKPIEGYSRIAVSVTGECNAGKPKKTAGGWVLTISRCQLPRKLQRMLDTSSFASPVQEITPYQVRSKEGYDTKLLVKLRSDVPFNFRQEGGMIYWDVKNPEASEKPLAAVREVERQQAAPATVQKGQAPSALEKELVAEKPITVGQTTGRGKNYTGRRVTLEFSEADVRKIFQLIAEVSNLNFLIADDVTGTISLKLVNVPWDQALDVILESKGLEMKREGNIVQIKPRGKFKTEEQEQAELKREREKRMELSTRVFEVNFAALGDIEKQFKELSSKLPGTSIIADTRTNKVIVIDNEVRLKNMADLLAKLDTPEKQVVIEARIVEASSTFTRDLGVQWAIHYTDGSASFLGINQLDTGFGGVLTSTPPATGFQAFDSGGGSMGVSFGKLTSNIQVDMRLSAAATAGLVKIISTPKVVTLNNKAAKISQGQSIPYQTTSAEGTKTQFVDATLSLEVTPHITADGNIGMKITASNNSAAAAPPGIAPAINKKEATTELQVMNGETTVIGGIYIDSDTETNTGVPFLMDIPLLGWMFKSNSKSKVKTELLIFITPRVVS